MIPVPTKHLAMIAWSHMVRVNCHPLGVLVYACDKTSEIANYMRGGGMDTADGLFRSKAGEEYGFIATDTPTDAWCAYAKGKNLLWWQVFGASFEQWRATQSAAPIQVSVTASAATGAAQASQPPAQPGAAPTTIAGAVATADVTIDATVDPTGSVNDPVNAIERDLLAHPNLQIGADKNGRPLSIARYQANPNWEWYYEEPFDIATVFRIDTIDVPSMKIRVSVKDKTSEPFGLAGVSAGQMTQLIQQLIVDPKFTRIIRTYRS